MGEGFLKVLGFVSKIYVALWSLYTVATQWLMQWAENTENVITQTANLVNQIVLPAVSFATGEFGPYLEIANAIFPISEFWILLVSFCQLWITLLVIRWIKKLLTLGFF